MTEQTQPTDAELMPCPFCGTQPDECDIGQFVVECPSCAIVGPASDNSNAARRAWNTRWGTPAGAGEPVAYLHDDGYWTAAKTGVGRSLNDRLLFAGSPKVAVYTTPQPTQAQAGAVPLKYARLHAISLDYSDSEDECTGFRDGWRAAEKHHGIKGADHA